MHRVRPAILMLANFAHNSCPHRTDGAACLLCRYDDSDLLADVTVDNWRAKTLGRSRKGPVGEAWVPPVQGSDSAADPTARLELHRNGAAIDADWLLPAEHRPQPGRSPFAAAEWQPDQPISAASEHGYSRHAVRPEPSYPGPVAESSGPVGSGTLPDSSADDAPDLEDLRSAFAQASDDSEKPSFALARTLSRAPSIRERKLDKSLSTQDDFMYDDYMQSIMGEGPSLYIFDSENRFRCGIPVAVGR